MSAVILVDGNDAHVNDARALLERRGYEVIHLRQGLQCLDVIQERLDDISMVLIELRMPDISGGTLATLLRRLSLKIPIIAVSASNDRVSWQRAISRGCSGFIPKPIDPGSFVDRLEAFARNPQVKPTRILTDAD